MKRPSGMPKWKWEQRNDPPSREEMTRESVARLDELKASGVKWVEWLTAGTGDECPHCLTMRGKVMRIEDVPFAEHPDCEHEEGCRCVLIAISAPDGEDEEWLDDLET
jgi:hypothetical protein